MALTGAEVLFYPTAIGSEPHDPTLDTHAQWQRAMQGHAVSNAVPVVARQPHRPGRRTTAPSRNSTATRSSPTTAASSSRASAPRTRACWCTRFDLTELESYRADWGFFRDRRTDLYAKSIV